MTTNNDHLGLDFPISAATIHDDRVVIHLERRHLEQLRQYLWALEHDIIEVRDVHGAGQG